MSARLSEYRDFAELQRSEPMVNYSILVIPRDSPVAIIVPHGGDIEPPCSEIGFEIAGHKFSYYSFIGNKRRLNNLLSKYPDFVGHTLHITSTRFDEPSAVALVENSEVVVAIHGRDDKDDRYRVWIGGKDADLRLIVGRSLQNHGFMIRSDLNELAGIHGRNICNRGRRGMGVQIEIPAYIRKWMVSNKAYRLKFVEAMRESINIYCSRIGLNP